MVQRLLRKRDAVDLKLMEHSRKPKEMPKRGAGLLYHQPNQKNLKIHRMMNKHPLPREDEVDRKVQRKRQLLQKLRVHPVKAEVVAGHAKMHHLPKKMPAQLKKSRKMKKKKRVLTSKFCLSHKTHS